MSETGLAFLLFFALGCLLCLIVRPIYGLYTYIAVFYLHPPSRWWGADLPGIRWALAAAIITWISMAIHNSESKQTPPWTASIIAKVLIAYTVWMWIQLPWVYSSLQLDGVILYTKYVILFYLMYSLIDSEETFVNVCMAHVLGCAYLGWLIYLAPDTGRLESVGGPGIANANTLGMHLATGVVFGGFLLFTLKGARWWAMFLTLPFVLNGVIQTETRGALVGMAIGGLATIYLKPKRYRKRYYALVVLGAVAFLSLANEAFLDRMSSLTAAVDEKAEWDGSAQSRVEIVKAQWQMFLDYPLGVGHQGTALLSPNYLEAKWLDGRVNARASHNTVMTVVVDQGIPGIVLMSILAVSVIRQLRRLRRMDARGLSGELGIYRAMIGGALVTIIGAGMFAQYFKAEVLIWTLCLLTVLIRLSELSVAAQRETPVQQRNRRVSLARDSMSGTF